MILDNIVTESTKKDGELSSTLQHALKQRGLTIKIEAMCKC